MAKAGQKPSKEWLEDSKKKLDACAATANCNARVACMKDIFKPAAKKPAK
jgi:hypothetical protein